MGVGVAPGAARALTLTLYDSFDEILWQLLVFDSDLFVFNIKIYILI